MPTKKESMLRKVQALLDKANSTTFSEERNALLEKADDLMTTYAISEFELATRQKKDIKAQVTTRTMPVAPGGSHIRDQLSTLHYYLTNHAGAKAVYYGINGSVQSPINARVVGFEADLDYVEMLFTSLVLQAAMDLEPKFDESLTLQQNIFVMKEAGLKWKRICELCGILDSYPGPKAINLYKKECKERNVEPSKVFPITRQRNFMMGFNGAVVSRLAEIRRHQMESGITTGKELVFVGRTQAVEDAFNEMFPKLRKGKKVNEGKFDPKAYMAGRESGQKANLGGTAVGDKRKELV